MGSGKNNVRLPPDRITWRMGPFLAEALILTSDLGRAELVSTEGRASEVNYRSIKVSVSCPGAAVCCNDGALSTVIFSAA